MNKWLFQLSTDYGKTWMTNEAATLQLEKDFEKWKEGKVPIMLKGGPFDGEDGWILPDQRRYTVTYRMKKDDDGFKAGDIVNAYYIKIEDDSEVFRFHFQSLRHDV